MPQEGHLLLKPRRRIRAAEAGGPEERRGHDAVEQFGLDGINAVVRAVEAERGTWRMAVEEAIEKAAALLMGMRAIALVMRNPLADSRREISGEGPEKRYNATAAIGYLLRLLDELASEGAAERWMSEDARGPQWGEPDRGRTRCGVTRTYITVRRGSAACAHGSGSAVR